MTLELYLNNFRCWEEKKLSFPDKGICLINGRSGKGKSTILNGILYAITGKLKNISTFNKKYSKVELKIDNIKITRSKGPNRLIVYDEKTEKTYEDDEAQSIIDSVFGSEFNNTSYIDQDNVNSFVYLSANEKIEFLEKLLLSQSNTNVEKIKEDIKNNISQTKNEYIAEDSKLSTLREVLKGMVYIHQNDLIIDKVKISESNYQKIYEKIKNNLQVSEKNKKTIQIKIDRLEEESKKYSLSIEKKKLLESRLDDIQKDISSFSYNNKNIQEIEDQIKLLEKQKQDCLNKKEYFEKTKRLKELEEKYELLSETNRKELQILQDKKLEYGYTDKKIINKLEKTKDILLKLYNIEDEINTYSTVEDYKDNISSTKETLDKNKDKLSTLREQLKEMDQTYKCPSCNIFLKFNQQSLVPFCNNNINSNSNKENMKTEIENLKKIISSSEKELETLQKNLTIVQKKDQEYNELYDQYEEMTKSYQKVLENEEDIENEISELEKNNKNWEEISQKIKSLENDRLILSLKKDISILKKEIEDYMENILKEEENNGKEDDIENNYEEIVQSLSTLNNEYTTLKTLYTKKKKFEEELKEIYETIKEVTDKNFEEMISSEKEKIDNYSKKAEQYRNYIDQMNRWNANYQSNLKYKELEDNIKYSEEVKDLLNDRLRCLTKLREHVKNAEKKAITDFVDSLNEHASIYIDQFFEDEDIKVELKTVQETKSTGKEKMSLNFELNYRQILGDLSYLSGGEKDRVNLAFTLAFSELVNNRILLLDECISSLDAETTNIVLENLKEKYKGKLVLLVSHQANLGFFDSVTNI